MALFDGLFGIQPYQPDASGQLQPPPDAGFLGNLYGGLQNNSDSLMGFGLGMLSGRCSSSPVSAMCTQSEGVPVTTLKRGKSAAGAASKTDRGRFRVSELEVPLAFCSGAMISISPSPRQARASAAMPGAR